MRRERDRAVGNRPTYIPRSRTPAPPRVREVPVSGKQLSPSTYAICRLELATRAVHRPRSREVAARAAAHRSADVTRRERSASTPRPVRRSVGICHCDHHGRGGTPASSRRSLKQSSNAHASRVGPVYGQSCGSTARSERCPSVFAPRAGSTQHLYLAVYRSYQRQGRTGALDPERRLLLSSSVSAVHDLIAEHPGVAIRPHPSEATQPTPGHRPAPESFNERGGERHQVGGRHRWRRAHPPASARPGCRNPRLTGDSVACGGLQHPGTARNRREDREISRSRMSRTAGGLRPR